MFMEREYTSVLEKFSGYQMRELDEATGYDGELQREICDRYGVDHVSDLPTDEFYTIVKQAKLLRSLKAYGE